ncbi:MAG TPA: ergothioneine biosynthesis protein EgtB [Burkholderiales bacterium]
MKADHAPLAQGELAERFPSVRGATVRLADGLGAEDCALQSMPDASPVKWHFAHTTWFFETFVLERFDAAYRPFRPEFRFLFNSYYNGVGEQFARPQRGMLSRPGLDEVLRYRAQVDERMRALLAGRTLSADALALIELGLHHEQQHQELIVTDVKHLLSLNPLAPAWRAGSPARAAGVPLSWAAHPGGEAQIGHGGAGFAFDNELPRHRVLLEPFELASRPATNAEYLAFIVDGCYRRPELWLSEGWTMAQAQRWEAPLYWRKRDGAWLEFTLHGLQALDPDAPVTHISHFEADAFARWSQARLPTEFELEAVGGAFADVWQWTSSSYGPYPGYRPAPGAVGEYNGKFMSNQYVLRGGSRATPPGHLRPSYRNFFPSSARWQFSGVRLARDPSY